MGLSIKHEETERLVRALARRKGVGVTSAVHLAVSNELRRDEAAIAEDWDRRWAEIAKIQKRWKGDPPIDMKEMDAWLYDENGVPH